MDASPDQVDFRTTLPDEWLSHYHQSNYQEIDPFLNMCCATFAPMSTGAAYLDRYEHLTPEQRNLIMEAAETGFKAGISSTFKMTSKKGAGAWNIMSDRPREVVEAILAEHGDTMQLAAFCAHQTLSKARSVKKCIIPQISSREAECLKWLATGLRTQQIAYRIGLKPVTVEFHLRNARKKLGAATREHALAIAISKNLISV